MKTLEKLYEEIKSDSELKKEYVKAIEDKTVIDFLKAHDCDATEAEVESFFKSKNEKNKELSDDELDMVSGGGACTTYTSDGWPVVAPQNSCEHYIPWDPNRGGSQCSSCEYVSDEEAASVFLICKCPQRHESIDDI